MTYKDLFQNIRDKLNDVDTDATANVQSAALGRAILAGVRRIQGLFPETRLDRRGLFRPVETVAYTETTANVEVDGSLPSVPLPMAFEPAIEAYVMEWCHARDARDQKDLDLARHWQNRFMQLTGEATKG